MSNWLFALAGYLATDVIFTILKTGKKIDVTPRLAAFTVLTHAVWITALVVIAMRLGKA